jgi:hypothetical protein
MEESKFSFDDMIDTIVGHPDSDEVAGLAQLAKDDIERHLWSPQAGPQAEAYWCKADILLFGGEAGPGKDLALDTPLPTPFGWTTMGEVQIGDAVIDKDGLPCQVVAKSEVFKHKTYRLTFSDGTEVVAGSGHQWGTSSIRERWRVTQSSDEYRARRRAERPKRGTGKKPWLAERNSERAGSLDLPTEAVRTTQEIVDTLKVRGRNNHSIQVAGRMNTPEADLVIDPYVLGCWLGDGATNHGKITNADAEVFQHIAGAGYSFGKVLVYNDTDPMTRTALGLKVQLRGLGVLGNKHIPGAYLRASQDQRLSLLQGLMDTDGTCDRDGYNGFTTIKRRLADDVYELICSLGIKTEIHEGVAKLDGRYISPKFNLGFVTDLPAFRIPRKLIKQKRGGFRGTHDRRYIIDAEEIKPVPTQCIQVDSPSHTYLCTKSFIPTHNSDLLLGLAFEEHQRSLIMRRQYTDLAALLDRAEEINGTAHGLNRSSPPKFRTKNGKIIDFGAVSNPGDEQKFKGQPHDFLGFDEVVDFLEDQVRLLITWVRSTTPGQRTRIVMATNPPTTATGQWIIAFFAPWLDVTHPNPAKPGELRWFISNEYGEDEEVDGPDSVERDGTTYIPMSRTFIPGKVNQNMFLKDSGYQSKLDSLPEPIRSAYRDGNFMASRVDAANQVIPAEWVTEANKRWRDEIPKGVPMTGLGVDASGGGADPLIIAPRYDGWFPTLIEVPGKEIPKVSLGKFCAGIIIANRRDNCPVTVDMGGGYGGPIFEHLNENQIECIGWTGAGATTQRTADRQLGYYNKRAMAYWQFREALDPDQDGGSPIALPIDPMLMSDLTAPTFEVGSRGIQITPKDKLVASLGRSPDRGDAVVMAWQNGDRNLVQGRASARRVRGSKPTVITKRTQRGQRGRNR